MKNRDEYERYDASYHGGLGYALAHGLFLDLRLWRPQSEEWKDRIKTYKRLVRADVYPSMHVERYQLYNNVIRIPSELVLRIETPGRLVHFFLEDAAKKEFERTGEKRADLVLNRAKKQLCKYLQKLKKHLTNENA